MKTVLLLLILMVYLSACTVENQTDRSESKNCFNPKNFSQLKEYIQSRINNSGMGKFYVEYPPDKTQPDDGIKRPSKNPENVYDIKYDQALQQIIFENRSSEFSFISDNGLIYKKNQTRKDHETANNIFCYLMSLPDNK